MSFSMDLELNKNCKINSLSHDSEHHDYVLQLCSSLEKLEYVSKHLLGNISNAINQKQELLDNFNKRIELAQGKINLINGTKKATTIFSTSKYPNISTERVNLQLDPFNLNKNSEEKKENRVNKKIVLRPTTLNKLKDSKKNYFELGLGLKLVGTEGGLEEKIKSPQPPPQFLSSLDSLLLPNTSDNIYFSASQDPKENISKKKKIVQEETESDVIGEAPLTLRMGTEAFPTDQPDFYYKPSTLQIPGLLLPDSLPNLLGIADDVQFCSDVSGLIGPSSFSALNLPPIFSDSSDLINQNEIISSQSFISPSSPPPPPPPPLPSLPPVVFPSNSTSSSSSSNQIKNSNPSSSNQIKNSTPSSLISSPPPPPPPPLPPSSSFNESISTTDQTSFTPPALSGDGRSSLMEAIRKVGGASKANLKNAKERRERDVKLPKKEDNCSSNDLMSDLTSILLMRRKGITGSKKTPSNPLNSLMEKIPVSSNKDMESDEQWD